MSSKIVRPDGRSDFQPVAWSSWSTEVIDAGAAVSLAVAGRETVRQDQRAIEELQKQLQQGAEAARKQGYQEGESAGRAACRREVEDAVRQMGLAVQNAVLEKSRLRAEAERDVVRIALAIARKIIRREVRIDPHVALGLVKAAIEAVGARELHVIRTTPALAQALNGGLSTLGVPEGVRVVADASLEPGGLVVETSRGEVDASIEVQLEEISNGLMQAVTPGGRQA